ncbi:hypothetical protein ACIP1U_03120 [Cupriavidus sp. NPDC089707]|uniref:hypothetical protein n=1 Tax=Cupriavidus sp. NPDC089707 TaxID=3363963 RepID=UPI00382BE4B5
MSEIDTRRANTLDDKKKSFAAELPEDCPFPRAKECDGEVFMLVKQEPITSDQVRSQAERGRARNAMGEAACMRHGLSVFRTFSECDHARRVLSARNIGDLIAVATLNADHGVIAPTPSLPGHLTWWPFVETQRETLFRVTNTDGA